MRRLALGAVPFILIAVPPSAFAVSDLSLTQELVPATATTGETVEARVTVTNVGDTSTESKVAVEWDVTDAEGGSQLGDFVMGPATCPSGSDDPGGTPTTACLINVPIAPGASVTAVFSGFSRRAFVGEARARVSDWGTGTSNADSKPLTIAGPTLAGPVGPRVSHLRLAKPRPRPGDRAPLRFTLDRRAKTLHAALFRCGGRTGCRKARFILNSTITRRGRRGPNLLRYPLPANLAPGRYRITMWAYEPFVRLIYRSVTLKVLPRRR